MKNKISLFCVPTPIGNLSDISPRVLEILASVDFIAAEDTRKSGILLKHFDIKKPMISYFEHNMNMRGEEIISRLKEGQTCAIITDAGMPAISDPGEKIVMQCYENGLVVSAIPGPCAAVTALAMSGLSTKRFCFEGFLSTAKNKRREHLESLKKESRTMIFYEAPHKLKAVLKDMQTHLGNRRISLVREISKIYEEARLTTIDEAVEYYENLEIRGEFVLIVEGAAKDIAQEPDEDLLKTAFLEKTAQGMSKTEAAKELASEFKMLKRDIYERFKDL